LHSDIVLYRGFIVRAMFYCKKCIIASHLIYFQVSLCNYTHCNKYTIGSCDDTILSKYPKVKNVPQKIYIKHLKKQTLSVLSTSHTFNGLTLVTIQNLEPT